MWLLVVVQVSQVLSAAGVALQEVGLTEVTAAAAMTQHIDNICNWFSTYMQPSCDAPSAAGLPSGLQGANRQQQVQQQQRPGRGSSGPGAFHGSRVENGSDGSVRYGGIVQTGPGGGSNGSCTCVRVEGVADIEENIWAPKFGLKGQLDASLLIRLHRGVNKKLLGVAGGAAGSRAASGGYSGGSGRQGGPGSGYGSGWGHQGWGGNPGAQGQGGVAGGSCSGRGGSGAQGLMGGWHQQGRGSVGGGSGYGGRGSGWGSQGAGKLQQQQQQQQQGGWYSSQQQQNAGVQQQQQQQWQAAPAREVLVEVDMNVMMNPLDKDQAAVKDSGLGTSKEADGEEVPQVFKGRLSGAVAAVAAVKRSIAARGSAGVVDRGSDQQQRFAGTSSAPWQGGHGGGNGGGGGGGRYGQVLTAAPTAAASGPGYGSGATAVAAAGAGGGAGGFRGWGAPQQQQYHHHQQQQQGQQWQQQQPWQASGGGGGGGSGSWSGPGSGWVQQGTAGHQGDKHWGPSGSRPGVGGFGGWGNPQQQQPQQVEEEEAGELMVAPFELKTGKDYFSHKAQVQRGLTLLSVSVQHRRAVSDMHGSIDLECQ